MEDCKAVWSLAATDSHLQIHTAEHKEVPSTDGGWSKPQKQHVLRIISLVETDRGAVGATAKFNRSLPRPFHSWPEISD